MYNIIYDVIIEFIQLCYMEHVVCIIGDKFTVIVFGEIACYGESCIMMYKLRSNFWCALVR